MADTPGSVLITGASRGLGRALLARYRDAGWRCFPVVRDTDDARRLGRDPDTHPIVADIARDDATAVIADALAARGDRLDVLVNNAGNVSTAYTVETATPRDIAGVLDVHCLGALRCVRAALPRLRAAPLAKIVNVSSRLGSLTLNTAGAFQVEPTSYAYRIAKAAQNMLTVCLSSELAAHDIGVYGVHPGKLQTEIGAADAGVTPRDAADALFHWIERADLRMAGGVYDLWGDRLPY